MPRHVDSGKLHAVLEHEASLGARRRRTGRLHGKRSRGARDLGKVSVRERQSRAHIDVSRERQRCVARVIVRLEERPDVLEARRLNIGRSADREPVIRVVGGIQRRDDGHAGEPVGSILVVLPALVEHHVALVLELGVGQRGQEVAHAIRFHPQRELQRVGRHHLPVVRAVCVGRAVQRRSRFLQRMKVALVVVL